MKMLIVFLGVVVGIVLFLGIVFLIIYAKIKSVAKKHNIGNISSELKDVFSNMEKIKEEESMKPKSISGMTSLLIPSIVKDFPDFNENLLFNMTEDSLRIIFDALNNKDKSKLSELPLVQDSISSTIDGYVNDKIDVNYSDIKFHNFALKDYQKKEGLATLTVTASVEYYFKKSIADKKRTESKYKKQTRYSCKFIYIYDSSKIKDDIKLLGSNCPNCGAAISSLGHKTCEYCGSAINDVNLKSWAFSSYKEY